MSQPRFSVVIPTRERAETLPFTLRTCLEQDFDDYEIIVCDNCSSPAVEDAIARCASPRMRYVRSSKVLSPPDNWNLAIGQVRGEFAIVIGSDDGLMPYALRELDHLIGLTGAKAMTWPFQAYLWPTAACAEDANYLTVHLGRSISQVSGRERIAAVLRNDACVSSLPNIYHGLIHRDLIGALRAATGTVFANTCFYDSYTAFCFAYLAKTYTVVGAPMTISGFSATSGGAGYFTLHATPFRQGTGMVGHPWVPNLAVMNVVMADSFLWAKQALFPGDADLVLDRRRMIAKCVSELWTAEAVERRSLLARIRATLEDSAELLDWFDSMDFMNTPPASAFRYRNCGLGFNGESLGLNANEFGVSDVAGAVDFSARLLGYRATAIKYDLPSRQAHLAAVQEEAERRLEVIHRLDGLLRQAEARLRLAQAESQSTRALCRELGRRLAAKARRVVRLGRRDESRGSRAVKETAPPARRSS
jgi:hypothetical protein